MNPIKYIITSTNADKPYPLYTFAIWLYIVLLVFEGALRKWFLPSFATPLLLIRDPIVIWLVLVGLQKGWLDFIYVKAMMIVGTLSFVFSLVFGHHNLAVALFGWRIYFFHFPMVFIIGQLLTRDDLLRICRFFLYISIPMTILIVIQFYSPRTSWVNIGVGGEGTSGFSGALGYMRPPGTFSFISGYVAFQLVVGCALFYYLIANNTLKKECQIPYWLLIVILICYLVSIPTSISRTYFFQALVCAAFVLLAAVFKQNLRLKVILFSGFLLLAIALLSATGMMDTNVSAFTARFEGANKAEGGIVEGTLGDRYLGGLLEAFSYGDIPILGYGLGLGTNVGSKLMSGNMYSFGFNGEVEWQRIVGECGLILGFSIIAIRLVFSLNLLRKSYSRLSQQLDLLPWMLSSGMILSLPQGQWGIPTNLGFSILLGGLTLAAIRTSTIHSKQPTLTQLRQNNENTLLFSK